MKNQGKSRWLIITLSMLGVAFILIIMAVAALTGSNTGNTAHIKIRGVITSDGGSSLFGDTTASAEDIIANIKKAEENPE